MLNLLFQICENFAPNLNFAGAIISEFNAISPKLLNLVPTNNSVLKVFQRLCTLMMVCAGFVLNILMSYLDLEPQQIENIIKAEI